MGRFKKDAHSPTNLITIQTKVRMSRESVQKYGTITAESYCNVSVHNSLRNQPTYLTMSCSKQKDHFFDTMGRGILLRRHFREKWQCNEDIEDKDKPHAY